MSAFRLPLTIKITVSLSAARKLGSACCTCWEIRGSQFVHPIFIYYACAVRSAAITNPIRSARGGSGVIKRRARGSFRCGNAFKEGGVVW